MKKLQKYLLAGASVSASLASGSVVYTDVDPDVYLDTDGENFQLDFDGDGVSEYEIMFEVGGFGGGWGPDVYQPNIAGLYGNRIGAYYLNGGGWGNPMLPENFIYPYYSSAVINANLDWSASDAIFGYYFFNNQGGGSQVRGMWDNGSENYAALKFTLDGETHYGWVRCFIDSQYKGITILDYGYNDTPDAAVATGSTFDPNYVANSIQATDIADNTNGLDLEVSFTRASNEIGISEYRVMAVKSADADNYTVGDANSNSHYVSVIPNGQNITTTFGELSKDADGEFIQEDIPYKVFVLSVPDLDSLYSSNLPQPSNEVTLQSVAAITPSLFDDVLIQAANGKIVINSSQLIDEVSVIDITGRNIYQNNTNKNFNIDLNNAEKSILFIQVKIGEQIETKKIIL